MFWKRFKKNKLALTGAILVFGLLVIAILAPFVSPYDPNIINMDDVLQAPGSRHILGTDDLGRDILSRMIYGTRISLSVGFVAIAIATIIGIILGSLAGYYGKLIDSLIMRLVDIMLSVPTFFLLLTIIAIVGPSIWIVMFVIGLTGWMSIARLVRAEFLTLKEREFVLAARSIGASDARIIFKHILPNAMSPVYVSFILGVAGAILMESGLSFLGFGVQPPTPSWGNILTAGREYMEVAWWLIFFPGLAILLTCLSYYILGEGIRQALDPKLKI
ncbi:MAG: ABC transporter permease [Candidatus Omnitrophica bacterium]|jgi:peptide/nickel transport system permease protein|nr:ABC transporter permease [Candidatus Omnitrophota bacterium]